jgi:hypothetical protein
MGNLGEKGENAAVEQGKASEIGIYFEFRAKMYRSQAIMSIFIDKGIFYKKN